MKYSKKRIYFKSYLINHFLYKNIYTEFAVLNNRDGNMCNSNELLLAVRSIPRKPQKSRNPRKFSFPSQTKYSPPIITFVHGVNLYLQIFFQMCKKSSLPILRIHGGEQIRRIGGNFEIFKIFCFSLLKSWRYYLDTSNN